MRLTLQILFVIGGLLALALNAKAQSLVPTPVTGESRMVTFPFDEDRIYKILVRPKNVTMIKLAPDEQVVYSDAGDKASFPITVPKSRQFIEIRPKWEQANTNLLLVTNRRTYHIELQSTGEGKKWYARVAWQYDDAPTLDATQGAGEGPGKTKPGALDVMTSVNIEKIDWKYEISGDAPFRPTQVFDDGTHTYVRLPDRLQQLPALVMETQDTGEKQMVDYAVSRPYVIVPRTMDRFHLILGKQEVAISKSRPADTPWWARGRSNSSSDPRERN